MSTTESSEAAANFIKTYTHDQFIKPAKKVYHGAETDSSYCNLTFHDIHLSDKILPIIGDLHFQHLKPSSRKSSNGSLNFPESVSEEGEEREWNDSSYEESDEVGSGDKVPELIHPRQVYQPDFSRSPKKSVMSDIDENAQAYLQSRGRRASAPVTFVMGDLKEEEESRPLPAVSKDEGDVPDTPVHVIELMKQEAAIMSQVKLRRMKHLDYRRGSCMPTVRSSPNLQDTGKVVSSERVHQIMQTLYGPQTKKRQQKMKHVGVHDPAVKSSNIHCKPKAEVLGGHADSPPRQPAIPIAPPPPEIMLSALMGDQKGTLNVPEVKQAPVELEKPKLTEVVATLNPSVSLPTAEDYPAVTLRRSSVTQDLEDTFQKLDRGSGEFSDSGTFTQSGESGSGGSSWFGGLIGLRPPPAPRKPGETRPAPVKKKVKKRDLNAFAPAGF